MKIKKYGVILILTAVILIIQPSVYARRIKDTSIVDILLAESSIIIETTDGTEFRLTYREEPTDDRFEGTRHIFEITTLNGEEAGYLCSRIIDEYADINEDFRKDPAYYYFDHPDNAGKSFRHWELEDLQDREFEPALRVYKPYSKQHLGEILIVLGLNLARELKAGCCDAINVNHAGRIYSRFGFKTIFNRSGIKNMRLMMRMKHQLHCLL